MRITKKNSTGVLFLLYAVVAVCFFAYTIPTSEKKNGSEVSHPTSVADSTPKEGALSDDALAMQVFKGRKTFRFSKYFRRTTMNSGRWLKITRILPEQYSCGETITVRYVLKVVPTDDPRMGRWLYSKWSSKQVDFTPGSFSLSLENVLYHRFEKPVGPVDSIPIIVRKGEKVTAEMQTPVRCFE